MSALPKKRSRLPWLLGFLALAAILVVTDKQEPDVVGAVSRGRTGEPGAAGGTGTAAARPGAGAPGAAAAVAGTGEAGKGAEEMILALRPRRTGSLAPDTFPVRNWNPPPPPPPPPSLVPAIPVPPPFAYTVLGKQFVDGRWEVFLGLRERTLVVKEGDTIDSQFRVERIAPPAMTLVAQGFDLRQSVPIGAGD